METKAENSGGSGGGIDSTEQQQMKFLVNNMKAEIDYLKKMFSVQKLQQID